MPTELRLRVIGGPEVMAALAARHEAVTAAKKRALSESVMKVYRKIALNLTGGVLQVQTGRLRQSMQTFIAADGSSATIGTNVEYARIHELGGQTAPHAIFPRNLGGALRFPRSRAAASLLTMTRRGKIRRGAYNAALLQFAHSVQHPGSVVPARPYMKPALEDSVADIEAIFVSHLLAALKGAA